MIGVSASSSDLQIAGELFELFKTPWEPVRRSRRYAAVLCSDDSGLAVDTEVVLMFSPARMPRDDRARRRIDSVQGPLEVAYNGFKFPVYGRCATFETGDEVPLLTSDGKAVDQRRHVGSQIVWRVGYDLFHEVRQLLIDGQPSRFALVPTLERHLSVLRALLLRSGISFSEIVPRPDGYRFICCLTHDLDFFGIRRHRFDRTMAGFVARASIGTCADVVRKRRPFRDILRNGAALARLPLVFMKALPDPWQPFHNYAAVEDRTRSTFFVVPFRGRPGSGPDGRSNVLRGVPYGASEIRAELTAAAVAGSEVALHGIDAWCDADAGAEERRELATSSRETIAGVRMHWLYFDGDSPRRLEAAGFGYDSTCGYNDAVGYRAGTPQVFRWPTTRDLMELPLSIMDSALLFSSRMALSESEAAKQCRQIVANASRIGGTVVVNWHDRSLSAERLWDGLYRQLLADIEGHGPVWYATARDAVDWFRWRRAIRFETCENATSIIVPPRRAGLPSAVVELHRPSQSGNSHSVTSHRLDTPQATAVAV
jgi:hypothetical protein